MALHCSQAKLWVKTHYERHEDGVVAKSVMYKHYEDFCRDQGRNIMETSIFGRVVKSVFPDVTIRRLGGRDNLKYYYCGIQAKESSPHAIDNATTTRPKRRLRKREIPPDKGDVHRCLVWLHKNYCLTPDSSVMKSEVYDRYVLECIAGAGEPLSMQNFLIVVSHAFPQVKKKKLMPRSNQHKFYFGLQERPAPLPLDTAPPELMRVVDFMFNNGRLCYRSELEHDEDDEDDDDCSCRSPVSDTSEGSLRDAHTPLSGEPPGAHALHYFHTYIKDEPVDYSLQHLKLKDEPLDDEFSVKEEPLDLHMPRDVHDMDTSYMASPERSPSVATSISDSPSPSVKDQKTRKIYKPRFHIISDYNDEGSWNSDTDPKLEKFEVQYCNNSVQSQWETFLRDWLSRTFEECERMCVNRDQVYAYYEKFCEMSGTTVLPLTYFDETVFKVFCGVVTMIHPSEKTFYEGIRVQLHSDLYSRIEELTDGEPLIHHLIESEVSMQQHSMELSPPPGAAPRISSLMLDDEDVADEPYADNYRDAPEEELHSTPEVLRDGKYYLRMWLTDNFESVPDSCVLKADAYRHYEAYAKSIKQTPFEMNVFGKIVRQVFPKVTIRRLGGRVKPQYHYCGIAVKTSSPLFQYMSGRDPAQRSRKKEIATDNKSAEIVIDWLRGHYEPGTERIIMKSAVFSNYCIYCKSINENPVTLNYFGKLVKHCFPNVEVRKCGGRSEPIWYYFGLVPRGEAGASYPGVPLHHHDLHDDIQVPQTLPETRQLSSMGQQNTTHTTSPIPISLSKGDTHLPAPQNGSYSTASMMLQSVLLNQHVNLAQSPLLNRRSPFPGSPGEGLLEASYQRPPHDPLYCASPTLTYPEHLTSHSPAAEGSSLQELRRQLLARSPYESGDVPSDNMFSRSPGDSSAQYCRSPGDSSAQYCRSPGDSSAQYCRSPGDSSAQYCRSPGDTSAQYCRSPRELLDGDASMAGHSPAETAIMFSHSPLEANYPGAVRPRSSLAGGSSGGQVVPGLTHQHALPHAHKRHRPQLQPHLDHYDMLDDIHLE